MLSGIDNHLNPLASVPAECNSLTVDERFAPFVGDYTEQPANLRHLAISYRMHSSHRQTSGRDPPVTLGKLGHLSQLISPKVKTPGNMSGLSGLGNLPKSLTSLYIEGWGDDHIIITWPDLGWSRESDCLGRLKDLTFHTCWVHIDIGSIANLESLTSLNLSQSHVGRDSDAILKLTNLECLDLTSVVIPRHRYPEDRQPWSRFEAWPAVCVCSSLLVVG